MPRHTLNTVIQKAIVPALCYSESLLDSWNGENDDVRNEIADIEAMRSRKLDVKNLSAEDRRVAFLILRCAEDWETSYTDSHNNKGEYAENALKMAGVFRRYRHTFFGKTQMEAMVETTQKVSVLNILGGKS